MKAVALIFQIAVATFSIYDNHEQSKLHRHCCIDPQYPVQAFYKNGNCKQMHGFDRDFIDYTKKQEVWLFLTGIVSGVGAIQSLVAMLARKLPLLSFCTGIALFLYLIIAPAYVVILILGTNYRLTTGGNTCSDSPLAFHVLIILVCEYLFVGLGCLLSFCCCCWCI